jgi:hypothetical protein
MNQAHRQQDLGRLGRGVGAELDENVSGEGLGDRERESDGAGAAAAPGQGHQHEKRTGDASEGTKRIETHEAAHRRPTVPARAPLTAR